MLVVDRAQRLWRSFRRSLLFVPTLMTLAALILFSGTSLADDAGYGDLAFDRLGGGALGFLVFAGGPDTGASVLEAIASTWATIAGVVFSITLITIQLSATKYSAQVIPVFERDRLNQVTLGAFTGTFVYSLLVLKTVRSVDGGEFVPLIGINVAVVLAVTSLFLLIAFIGNLTAYIRPTRFVDDYARSGMHALPSRGEPGELENYRPVPEHRREGHDGHERSVTVRADEDGYVEKVDWERLRRALAPLPNLSHVHVYVSSGERVLADEALVRLDGLEELEPSTEKAIRRAFSVETTSAGRDPGQVLDTIADVGVTSMSGGATDVGVAKAALRGILELTSRALERVKEHATFMVELDGHEVQLTLDREAYYEQGFRASKRVMDKAVSQNYWDVGEAFARHSAPIFCQAAGTGESEVWERTLLWFRPIARDLFEFKDARARHIMVRGLRNMTGQLREQERVEQAMDVEFILLEAAREAGVDREVREAIAGHAD